MDRLISDLTVAEFIGVMALMFFVLFFIAALLYSDMPIAGKCAALTALIGVPIFVGIQALFPIAFF